jgi:putative oxidoreductase
MSDSTNPGGASGDSASSAIGGSIAAARASAFGQARSGPSVSRPASVGGLTSALSTRGLTMLGVVVTRFEIAIAALFLLAAYNKLFITNGPKLFSASVEAFKVMPSDMLVRVATSVVPWVELIAAGLLMLGIWSRASAAVLGLLLVSFIVLIAQALGRGLNVECGCFGKLSPFCPAKLGMCNIVQNAVMLLMAGLIVVTPRHRLVRA